MKTIDILLLDAPALDGRDEVYYIVFLANGEISFIHGRYSASLSEIAVECKNIYRYNYWKIDAKYIDGKFQDVEFGSDEYNHVSNINKKYVDCRFKRITDANAIH
jgi:hypothetical protein